MSAAVATLPPPSTALRLLEVRVLPEFCAFWLTWPWLSSVAPRGDRPAFEVHAGDVIVRVVGTRFRVARDGEHARVTVDHGAVEIRFRGRALRLADGQSWSTDQEEPR